MKVAFTKADGETELYAEKEHFGYVSQYPTLHPDYVKATTEAPDFYHPYYATDPSKSLTGTHASNSWASAAFEEDDQRFHIDLGSAIVINRIYYENYHEAGANTDKGANNFTFWGSNTEASFLELTYGTDTAWTQLTTSQATFDEHTGSDVADPKYITVTNSTAYQYYAFKFADNHGDLDYLGVRRIELQEDRTAVYHVSRDGWVINANTSIFMYYGAGHGDNTDYIGATNTVAAEKVWNDEYVFRSGMTDGADTSHIYDSTDNDNDGTKTSANNPLDAKGKIGQGQNFSGDRVGLGAPADFDFGAATDFSYSAVVKTAMSGTGMIIAKRGAAGRFDVRTASDLFKTYLDDRDGHSVSITDTSTTSSDEGWHIVAVTHDRDGMMRIYIDGTEEGTAVAISSVVDIDETNQLEIGNDTLNNLAFDGFIDEVRVSKGVARSAAWEKGTYNSLWDTLLTYGSEETEAIAIDNAIFFGANF
jgi:hypothetical protein